MDNPAKIYYGYVLFVKPKDKYFITRAEQETIINKWAKANNVTMKSMHVDFWKYELSSQRPEFPKLLKSAEKGSTIVFASIPCLSRNLEDRKKVIEEMKRLDVRGVFISEKLDTSTVTEEDIRDIFTREKVIEAMPETKPNSIGRSPYGWKKMGEQGLIEVPEQQEVIKLIQKLRDEGKMSWYSIGQELMCKKVETPSGGLKWAGNTVKHIYERQGQ